MEQKRGSGTAEYILIILLVISGVILAFVAMERVNSGEVSKQIINSKLVLYDGPASIEDATIEDLDATGESFRDFTLKHCVDTQVQVNGYDCYVYDTNVNHTRQWSSTFMPPIARTPIAYFDFEGIAEITVTVPEIELKYVKSSSVSYGIEPIVEKEGNRVTVVMDQHET